MRDVENFRRKVKRIIETEREATTTYGVNLLLPEAALPTTIGRRGRMQGAKTVNAPAINEMSSNAILFLFYFGQNISKITRVAPFLDRITHIIDLNKCMLYSHAIFLSQ